MEFQIITNESGKVLAVLSYCTLSLAQEVARRYARVLGCATYRFTHYGESTLPKIGEVRETFVRFTSQRFT